jgi:hypothetical protein
VLYVLPPPVGHEKLEARRDPHEYYGELWQAVEQLGGFCLLLKRQVLDKIGPLEGQAGLSIFDTALLCARARQAGFTQACARDLFVHHFGSRTFAHGGPQSPATDKP